MKTIQLVEKKTITSYAIPGDMANEVYESLYRLQCGCEVTLYSDNYYMADSCQLCGSVQQETFDKDVEICPHEKQNLRLCEFCFSRF